MKKFKLRFTIKFADEIELTEEEYQVVISEKSKGVQIISAEELREDIADFLELSKDNLEVVEYIAEVVDEGKGE